jgi:hypothetical protein
MADSSIIPRMASFRQASNEMMTDSAHVGEDSLFPSSRLNYKRFLIKWKQTHLKGPNV